MKLHVFIIVLILVSGILFSCKEETKQQNITDISCPDTSTIIRQLSPPFTDSLIARETSLAGVEDLRHGFKDFQLRIWRQSRYTNKLQLFVLKQTGNSWEALLYHCNYILDESGLNITGVRKRKEELRSKTDWVKIGETLALPDLYRQGGIDDQHSDQSGATVELSECGRYKIFFQPVYKVSDDNANSVGRLLWAIEKEFGAVWVD